MLKIKYNKNPYYEAKRELGVKRIFRNLTEEEAEMYPNPPVGCPPCPSCLQLWGLIAVQIEEEKGGRKKKTENAKSNPSYQKKYRKMKVERESRKGADGRYHKRTKDVISKDVS